MLPSQHYLSHECLDGSFMKFTSLAKLLEELVQVVVDSVCTHDLVGHICTQHDARLVLQNRGDEPWPQVQSERNK